MYISQKLYKIKKKSYWCIKGLAIWNSFKNSRSKLPKILKNAAVNDQTNAYPTAPWCECTHRLNKLAGRTVPVKGLSHEMDLAFYDVYG
jgi:hypothetical protein